MIVVIEDTHECGMTVGVRECVWMFLFSCLNKTIVRTTSCAAACSWTLILTNRRKMLIRTHSHTHRSCFHSWSRTCWLNTSGRNDVIKLGQFQVYFLPFFFFCQAGQTGEITAPLRLIRGKEREEEKCVCVRGQVSERGEKHKKKGRGGEKRRRKQDERGCQARCQHAGLI